MWVRILLVLMLALAFFHPLIETVDFWDNFPLTGQDTESNVLALMALLALVFLLMFRVSRLLRCFFSTIHILNNRLTHCFAVSEDLFKLEVLSPPALAPLRI